MAARYYEPLDTERVQAGVQFQANPHQAELSMDAAKYGLLTLSLSRGDSALSGTLDAQESGRGAVLSW